VVKFTGAFGVSMIVDLPSTLWPISCPQHQVLSITDPRAITYILSEDTYRFPKPDGVRAWFSALLGEGILWVEGIFIIGLLMGQLVICEQADKPTKCSAKPLRRRWGAFLCPSAIPKTIFCSQQSIRDLTPIFYETSVKVSEPRSPRSLSLKVFDAASYTVDEADGLKPYGCSRNWGDKLGESFCVSIIVTVFHFLIWWLLSLDTIARAAFSYDFDCLSREHHLAETLDELTNQENNLSSFYMRALFWIFPPILSVGEKGQMIRRTKKELGDIALRMLKDAKIAGDTSGKTLMALMRKCDIVIQKGSINVSAVKANKSDDTGYWMNEDHMIAQLRTVISAGYETISATVAVGFTLNSTPFPGS
jgi:hypothetical protein